MHKKIFQILLFAGFISAGILGANASECSDKCRTDFGKCIYDPNTKSSFCLKTARECQAKCTGAVLENPPTKPINP